MATYTRWGSVSITTRITTIKLVCFSVKKNNYGEMNVISVVTYFVLFTDCVSVSSIYATFDYYALVKTEASLIISQSHFD